MQRLMAAFQSIFFFHRNEEAQVFLVIVSWRTSCSKEWLWLLFLGSIRECHYIRRKKAIILPFLHSLLSCLPCFLLPSLPYSSAPPFHQWYAKSCGMGERLMMKCFTSAYKLVVEKNRWNITEQDDKNYTEDHTQVSGNANSGVWWLITSYLLGRDLDLWHSLIFMV